MEQQLRSTLGRLVITIIVISLVQDTDSRIASSCSALADYDPSLPSGIYSLSIQNVERPLYCAMAGDPKAYIPLVAGTDTNYAYFHDQYTATPTVCVNESWSGQVHEAYSHTTFTMYALDTETLIIDKEDLTYSQIVFGGRLKVGVAADCLSYLDDCRRGRAMMDLTGTGFAFLPYVRWVPTDENSGIQVFNMSSSYQQAYLQCGGYCGGCTPDSLDLTIYEEPDGLVRQGQHVNIDLPMSPVVHIDPHVSGCNFPMGQGENSTFILQDRNYSTCISLSSFEENTVLRVPVITKRQSLHLVTIGSDIVCNPVSGLATFALSNCTDAVQPCSPIVSCIAFREEPYNELTKCTFSCDCSRSCGYLAVVVNAERTTDQMAICEMSAA